MKLKTILSSALAVLCAVYTSAQSLNVNCGGTVYSFHNEQTGVINFTDGTNISIQGRTFAIADIASMKVEDGTATDNTVEVVYKGSEASVLVAGNIARYIDVSISGANVSVSQGDEVGDDTCGEITYILSGASTDGSFTLNGNYKASVELSGLSLTSLTGAAIDLQNGKRVALRVQEGTENTLADGAGGSQKAALYCKGHLEFKQKGILNVTGNKAHAISAKEYIEIKNTTINILSSKKDGINCNQYLLIESGTVSIDNVADDGIQVAFKDDTDREAEDTGTITIKGGTLNINVTADAAKAIKADGDFVMTKGTVNATVDGGGIWDTDNLTTKASSCIGADGNLDISGGTLTLTANGAGGKGISVDGNLSISGGNFVIHTYGGMLAYVNGKINNNYTGNADNIKSDYKSSPKGIKVDGDIVISGGTFDIQTKGAGGEGIESKKTLTIEGGTIVVYAYEDGTNSSSHTYLKGGDILVVSKTGDAIDSNGAIYVSGGNIRVIGAGGSEQGFDAGDNYTIYFTGGTMLAAGGGNSAPKTTNGSNQAYVTLSKALTAGQTVTVSQGSTTLASFVVPDAYDSATAASRGPGGGNWGWGGSSGSALLLSSPDMVSGTTYNIQVGTTTTTATAKLTGGSSGPGTF